MSRALRGERAEKDPRERVSLRDVRLTLRSKMSHALEFPLAIVFRRLGASLLAALTTVAPLCAADTTAAHEVILVIGAPGETTYQSGFTAAADAWRAGCARAKARLTVIGLETDTEQTPTDHDRVRQALAALNPTSATPVWIIYVGHGSFDGKQAWWNLRGPDISGEELSQALAPLGQRTVIVVHGGAASAPFIPLLSGPGRIIISATRSGSEVNYARFGERFAAAIVSPRADLDQDGATSLLEAFLQAEKDTQLLYSENGRMATEHALIDDNGDKLGTPADWFQGTRVVKRPDGKGGAVDGFRAHQIALIEAADAPVLSTEQRRHRDAWEQELDALRGRRATMPEAEYLEQIERVLRRLSALYSESKTGNDSGS